MFVGCYLLGDAASMCLLCICVELILVVYCFGVGGACNAACCAITVCCFLLCIVCLIVLLNLVLGLLLFVCFFGFGCLFGLLL